MIRRVSLAVALFLGVAGCSDDGPTMEPPPTVLSGSARIVWTIRRISNGEAIRCQDINIESAAVSVGGEPAIVPCGEEQAVLFENLLAQRFPVIVELRTLNGRLAYQRRDNVIVEGGKQVELEIVFEIDPVDTTKGSTAIVWAIDDEPASVGCERVGGATVRVTDLPGSIEPVVATAPCADGTVTIDGMRPGQYGFFLELFDAANGRIAVTSIGFVQVTAGEIATPDEVAFITQFSERARLFASWTVNSSVATAGCLDAGADAVIVRAFPEQELIATVTASSACSAGSLRVVEVPASTRPHRVIFQLYSGYFAMPPLPILLTSTIVRNVLFLRGETSSVAADLRSQ